jgi:hypothetical protein
MAAAAMVTMMAGCGDGTGPEIVPSELVGMWVAEPACLPRCGFTLERVGSPGDTVNVTAFTGITTEIAMTRDGGFRLRTRPGPDTASTARVRVSPGMLVVTDVAGTVDTLDYSLQGQMLHLRFRRTFSVFDFTGNGQNDPAVARGRFEKR